MSTQRDVPLEVLEQIFIACHNAFYSQSDTSPPWPEVSMSHVCQRWRDVALSSHLKIIWSVITYDYRRVHDLARIKIYVQRSTPLPVDITANASHRPSSDDREDPTVLGTEVLDYLCAETQLVRWKAFTLLASPGDNYHELVKRLRTPSAPLLEYFSIRNVLLDTEPSESQDPVESLNPHIFVGEGAVPKLTSIHLTDVGLQCFIPPLTHVVELCLEGPGGATLITWTDLIEIILQLPTLRKLSIIGDILSGSHADVPDFFQEITPTTTIHAPYITHLRYDAAEEFLVDWSFFNGVLPRLSAPKLEVLILGNIREDQSFADIPTTGDEVVVSFPKLKTLVLQRPSFWDVHGAMEVDEMWYTWLSGATTPSLETLKIIAEDPQEESILASDDLWPEIKDLVYAPSSDYSTTMTEMMTLLLQFASERPTLRTIRLPSPLLRAMTVSEGPSRDAFETLQASADLKAFSTLWEVAPEVFTCKTTRRSLSLPVWEEDVGDSELGGRSTPLG
jgi:hypothetical protein